MEHNITLVLGDWSDDGHGKTETIQIASNLTSEQMWEAYKKATEKIGFDFCETVASNYEDSRISHTKFQQLVDAGFTNLQEIFEHSDDDDITDDDIYLNNEQYARIFLGIVTLGNPDFYSKIIEDKSNEMRIGGYGLFS